MKALLKESDDGSNSVFQLTSSHHEEFLIERLFNDENGAF